MRVSFVIPNWDRRELLAAAIASIRAQTCPALEILVVDNGSRDGSGNEARRLGAVVIQLGKNRGFSFAANRGIEAAQGDAIALVNNDVELSPDWTERLVQSLEQRRFWFAIGRLLQYHARDRIDGVGDAICRGGTSRRLGNGRPDGPVFHQSRGTFFPSGTAVLARRELFARTGPFDETFFAYLEDADLGLRAALLGLEGVYVPQAVAYHRGSATLGPWSGEMVKWITRNQILLLAKYYPASLLWSAARSVAAAQALWAAMALSRGRWLRYLQGLGAAVAGIRAVRRAGERWRQDGTRLATILLASERELEYFERSTGWDRYWRWYFRLAPLPRWTQP